MLSILLVYFVFSWAVRMPKFSSWNDERLLCFNYLFMHSLQLIFSKNWVCWSQKFSLNLKFCGLRVLNLSLSCWGTWYDKLELPQTCSEQNFSSGIFIFQNFKMKSYLVMKYSHQSHMHEAYKETIHLHAPCIILSFAKFCDLYEFLFILSWSRIMYTLLPFTKTSTPEE